MPTEKDDPESSTSEAESGPPEDPAPSEKQKQAATAKRRTKTGCLTCRRRRIKCGEEKPTCKNCIKSKRECAGYVQPLVYKQEHHAPTSTIQGRNDAIYRPQDQPFIPREYLNMPMQQHHFMNTQPPFQPHAHHQPYQNHPQYVGTIPVQARAMQYQNIPADPSPITWPAGPSHLTARYPEQQDFAAAPTSYGHMYASATPLPAAVAPFASAGPLYSQASIPFDRPEHLHHPQYTRAFEDVTHDFSSHPQASNRTATVDTPLRQYNIHGFVQHPTLTNPVQSFAIPPVPTTHLGADPEDAFEDPEDPFDVDMDDSDMSFNDAAESLQGMLDRSGKTNSQQSSQSNARRRQPQTVATYKPTVITSPLRDERNERIFCHFVEITSHCMSIFERHHYAPISLPSRTLWNFTIPALAMSHAALAHSILALGALHLAKLQGLSEDNAVKHFTYSVRRVGKLLGLPKRRHEIATLATVLVLGFYEILTGDHSRWFLHLGGATRLMMEHDYAALTRTARRMRSGAKARVHQRTTQFALTEENYARVAGIPLALLDDVDWEVDAQLVSRLVGLPVDYDTQHQPGFPSPGFSMDLSTNDVEEFKVKMDLRWWYCKQDIFGSMISGDPLLMPFENYIYCPPRGQIGRSDNPYATLDHMLLIMGRITDFGGKDRARKQRAVKSQGGQWRPPPWLFPQGPPGGPPGGPRGGPGGMMSGGPTRPPQHESQATSMQDPKTVLPNTSGMNKTKVSMAPSANEGRVRRQSRQGPPGESPPGAPPMYGMMPTSSVTTEMNSAYKAMDASMKDPAFQNKREERQVSPPKSLEEETARAFAEHESITKAFDLYRSCLGPDFDQLPLSDVTPYSTPFGPALIYKNPAIANLWLFYNVGRILLHRFHPEMPPAAMISAGVTAHLTKDYAQTVGRICAGLYSPHYYGQKGPLDPGFAGALMESTFQLLFAAVQFQDAAQRGWTITKLQDVALRCGWQTSGAVAAACEIAWERMGQAGRGPPYERTLDVNNKDVRVSGKFSRDASASTNNFRKSDDAVADYELEFVNHDRNLIDRSGSTRTHWALGLLSVEEDIKKMTIDDE